MKKINKYDVISFILFIIMIIILAVVIMLSGAFKKTDNTIVPKQKEEKTKEEISKERCEKGFENLHDKFIELGFTYEKPLWYTKGDYRNSSQKSINLTKENYKKEDVYEIYELLSNFITFDRDLFIKLTNYLPLEKNENVINALEINKDGYQIEIDYYPYDKHLWIVADCSWFKKNSFTYNYYNNSKLDDNIKFIKQYFNRDISFVEIIKHMVNESKSNHTYQESSIKYHDIEVKYHPYNTAIEFIINENYSSNRINYVVMRDLDNYKDILKKDLSLLDKSFKEDVLSKYDDIVKIIDKREYMNGRKLDGVDSTGSYYVYEINLGNGNSLELNVYEDKVTFKYDFRE